MKKFYKTNKDFPKLSTVLRETNHESTNIFKDNYVLELLNLPKLHSKIDLQSGLVGKFENHKL